MATGSGFDFSAEKLLSADFIAQAQRLLGSSAITVSVPRRTVNYATSAPAGTPEFEQFSAVTWATWLDDSHGNAPITTMLFRFEGADIVGASVLDPQPPPSPRRRGLFRRNR